jgi:hypothetical protein
MFIKIPKTVDLDTIKTAVSQLLPNENSECENCNSMMKIFIECLKNSPTTIIHGTEKNFWSYINGEE